MRGRVEEQQTKIDRRETKVNIENSGGEVGNQKERGGQTDVQTERRSEILKRVKGGEREDRQRQGLRQENLREVGETQRGADRQRE